MNRRNFLLSSGSALAAIANAQAPSIQAPLVELFTSQGCSSCPPADRVLMRLHAEGAAVVLSEHVDYWNYIGWRDPFSARLFSERQAEYSRRLRLDNIYTPQAIVNGEVEMVGSDEFRLRAALRAKATVGLRVSELRLQAGQLHARIAVAGLSEEADIWVALAQRSATVRVERGENSGRTLEHVSVAKLLRNLGRARDGANSEIHLPAAGEGTNLRLVAWLQRPEMGRVLGAASWDLT
jgi:hypothetical protein